MGYLKFVLCFNSFLLQQYVAEETIALLGIKLRLDSSPKRGELEELRTQYDALMGKITPVVEAEWKGTSKTCNVTNREDVLKEALTFSKSAHADKFVFDTEMEAVQQMKAQILPRNISSSLNLIIIGIPELMEAFPLLTKKLLSLFDPIVNSIENEFVHERDQFISAITGVINKETDNKMATERDTQLVSWMEDLEQLTIKILQAISMKVGFFLHVLFTFQG